LNIPSLVISDAFFVGISKHVTHTKDEAMQISLKTEYL